MTRRPSHAVVLPDIPLTGSTTVHQSSVLKRLQAAARRDEGATALEFAIVLPVVISVIFFALYGAMYFFYGAVADHVARAVVREVVVPNNSGVYPSTDAASIETDAKNAAGGLLPDPQCAVSTLNPINPVNPDNDGSSGTCPSAGSTSTLKEGDLVTVTVVYHLPLFGQLASLIPGTSALGDMSRSASGRAQ